MEFDEPCWDEVQQVTGAATQLQRENASEEEDELREECGVFGCVLAEDARCNSHDSFVAETISLGLHSLQHRGQQSAGIATGSGMPYEDLMVHKNNGLVTKVFTEDVVCKLTGRLGIGHNRYTTTGGNDSNNCQPFVGHNKHGPFAIAHNGQLINAASLTKLLFDRGLSLTTRSDSELITQVISLNPIKGEQNGPDWRTRIRFLMKQTPTSYSLAVMNRDKIYAVRDPLGNRPLCVGELRSNESDAESKPLGWLVSSESCAFLPVGARYLREILPGEILEISPKGLKRLDIVHRPKIYRPRATITLDYEESDVNQAASLRNSEISGSPIISPCCDTSKTGCLGPYTQKYAMVNTEQPRSLTQANNNDNLKKESSPSKSEWKKESLTVDGNKQTSSNASINVLSLEKNSRTDSKVGDIQAEQKDGRSTSDNSKNLLHDRRAEDGDLLERTCSAVSNLKCSSSSSHTCNSSSTQSSSSHSAISSSASSCSLSSLSDEDNVKRTKRRCSAAKKCTAPVAFCIFEYVYFARPDSVFEGHSVYEVRYNTGVRLAVEHPVVADFVACIPTTASVAAKGFSNKSGLPYMDVLYRSHFVGRSFIESDQNTRKRTVRRKFSLYSESNVRGKRVVLVDDSLVRGTTIEPIVEMLKNAGALEVHLRVASPPIRHPCYMGINIPTKEELAANRAPLDQLAANWGLDSLKYISLEGLRAAVNDGLVLEESRTVGHCTACLDGIYPVELDW
ncbi:Amidophosphoribosyltransferase [Trinorchestia longiramus]|nr:Amidophosphoribosyltransferase [Trinorchestia longiramus]